MPQAFNIPAILKAVRQAEIEALEQVSSFVVADARRRAPIRKVFKERKGFRRKFRELTPNEKLLAIKRATAYYGAQSFKARQVTAHIRNYAKVQVPRQNSNNSLNRSRRLRVLGVVEPNRGTFVPRTDARQVVNRRTGTIGFNSPSLNPLLTSRGRYEVRSGRAIHRVALPGGGSRVEIGGKLKASIDSEGAIVTGEGATERITAAIGYAKYVEFPTVRTHAQPFLLPALQDSRQRLVKTMSDEVRKALGG